MTKVTETPATTTVDDDDVFLIVDAGTTSKKITGADLKAAVSGGGVLDIVERDTDLVVTATTAAGAQDWIVGNSVEYSGSQRIVVEGWCPVANGDSGNDLIMNLWEDSTDLGRIGIFDSVGAVAVAATLTPSAGSHTYKLKVWKGSGSGHQFSAGPSSASGILVNAFMRISTA